MRTSTAVFPLALLLLPLVASCWAGPQPPVIWAATSADTSALKADLSKFDNGLKAAHPTAINAIVGEARSVLASPEFQGALANIVALQVGVDGSPMDGAQVARILLGMDPTRPGLPITFASPGDPARSCKSSGRETGHTGFGGGQASICLQSVTLERAVGESAEEKACAVNTIVHEWTHTIPDPKSEPGKPDSFFQDGGHTGSKDPLVSYTVGALAQCIYLTQHGYPMNSTQLASCIKGVGTITFIKNACEPGWAASFIKNTPASRGG